MTDAVVLERTLTQEDFDLFASLSGDDNPIHVSPEFSARTRFGRTVSHGVLLLSVLRGLADRLVPGARQIEQSVMYPAPTFAGEAMRFSAQVSARLPRGVEISMQVTRIADGAVTCEATGVFAP
ncbi:MAG: MaoC/PaaZ C-terminal domain-containing protein [Hyphomonadaceae bacterium]|nr:MaoC/PaaZ C-terminal domain-containing protein [Hyphomonadaceae bacterium]